jgi:predicted unusual protein kinase regulating ubiquinone biosynthesis (AarF/ABC1/UbiB family)
MQDLKSPRSAFDSATANGADRQHENGHLPPNPSFDPGLDPDFLIDLDDAGAIPPQSAIVPVAEPHRPPDPSESTVDAGAKRGRSLRMQWRFWRTIVFAGWLFARLIFWQVYVRKYAPAWVDRTNMRRWQRYARQFRHFAVDLGGVYIKLGQFISTRFDLLPEEIIRELQSLQDEVPTLEFRKIRAVIESELGPLPSRFQHIGEKPIAAASLGQVHKARLLNGDKVVVKVQRPGIREICYTDLAAMRVVGRIAMRWKFISSRCDAVALVDEFGHVLLEELSYKHEAHNAHRFAEMFKDNMGVYIPSVYYPHSTDRVLVMEDVTSIKINDYEALERAGISRKAVAERLMDTYLEQVFDHYFFHADPHPGNLFIYPLPVQEGQIIGREGRPFYLIFIDFGMTGTLTRSIAGGLVGTLQAVLSRDARRLIQGYIDLGFIRPTADIDRIVEAAEATFDQVWGLTMTELREIDYDRMADLAEEFNDLIFSMPFYIPQDFIYLGRTISILSGMSTALDAHFNPWNELQPYMEKLVARGFGIRLPQNGTSVQVGASVLQSLFSGNGSQALRSLGGDLIKRTVGSLSGSDAVLRELRKGELRVVAELSLAHRAQLKRLEKESRRTQRSVFFGSLLVSATLLYTAGETSLALAGYGLAAITALLGALRD